MCRYPTFIDSLRDLDDALSMCSLFATLPANSKIKADLVKKCQCLTAEFQHYIIASKSLKKVFLSIKGIYYQAEIQSQPITWIVPYQFSQYVCIQRKMEERAYVNIIAKQPIFHKNFNP